MKNLFTYIKNNQTILSLLCLTVLIGLGLRLLAWNWREFYGLGGDEQEYFNQALTLLRERQYVELRLMRPPLYTIFLAGCIYLFDSFVQNIRLIQALISTATIPLVFLASRAAAQIHGIARPERPALIAALLCALSYSLAVNATELLTETLFLFGLTAVIWLLLWTAQARTWWTAGLAGLVVGALCLVRSVGLPLLPLGVVWLLLNTTWSMRSSIASSQRKQHTAAIRQRLSAFIPALAFGLAVALVVAPWTIRNYLTYGGVILIDTTGAENLWLDNDPAGREAVKAQLYALGEDRLLRQQLSTERGIDVISADPARFVAKALGELQKFFALEFSDDMRARPEIWIPPAEVAIRLLLGDGIWLVLLLAGSYGLACGLLASTRHAGQAAQPQNRLLHLLDWAIQTFRSPAWLLTPWVLYVLLTTLIFHVELRYRLPLYPALLIYAGIALSGAWRALPRFVTQRRVALLVPLLAIALTLWHRNYPALAWQLGNKHWLLNQSEAALDRGDVAAATQAAELALRYDGESALAHVALAQAAILNNQREQALEHLDTAIATMPFHPYAHLLRGDLLRAAGTTQAAQEELSRFERASLQDLQQWSRERFISPSPEILAFGNGLDLGFIQGFHLVGPADQGFRWTTDSARFTLAVPPGSTTLSLRLNAGPIQRGTVAVRIQIGNTVHQIDVAPGWNEYRMPLPTTPTSTIDVTLSAPTFLPRQYDAASPDGRRLGVMIAEAATE